MTKEDTNSTTYVSPSRGGQSERGIALVMVMILSAVSLIMITTMLYLIAMGTRTSGMEKRYRTALEAGVAGTDILRQVIVLRGDTSSLSTLSPANVVPETCIGKSVYSGMTYTGLGAKIWTSTTGTSGAGWTGCNQSINLDPQSASTYDLTFQVGMNPSYTVYAKIVNVVEGNTGSSNAGGNKLLTKGVVSANSGGGEISIVPMPYLYTMEVEAENAAAPDERAELSVLYQY